MGQAELLEQAVAAAAAADEDDDTLPRPPPNDNATWQELLRRSLSVFDCALACRACAASTAEGGGLGLGAVLLITGLHGLRGWGKICLSRFCMVWSKQTCLVFAGCRHLLHLHTLAPSSRTLSLLALHTCCPAHYRYCLLSRSSLRVSESQLTAASPDAYAIMSDDMVMVHAAVELGHKVSSEGWDLGLVGVS